MKLKLTFTWKGTLLLCVALFLFVLSYAQNIQLKGHISDAGSKKSVTGATVESRKTKATATTDADGNFTISSATGDELTVTFVGFQSKTVTVKDNSFLEISITPGDNQLNEVVVTALGIKKETKRLGYAVQEVKGSDLLKARESNPINGLVGKVAGLNVGINQEMLASPTVLLRGSPLNFYVVDGTY